MRRVPNTGFLCALAVSMAAMLNYIGATDWLFQGCMLAASAAFLCYAVWSFRRWGMWIAKP